MGLFKGFLLLLLASQSPVLLAQSTISPKAQYFFNQASFPTGRFPHGVAIADMNGDGRPDLVIANSDGPSISILLGQADGTFAPRSDFLLPESPTVLVTGDFNGDGKIDVAVSVTSGVTISLGNGDGTLRVPASYASTNVPYLLAVSDFNRDGIQDLALAGACGDTCGFVSVLLGKGDGTFQAATDFSAGGVPSALTLADLNGVLAISQSQDGAGVLWLRAPRRRMSRRAPINWWSPPHLEVPMQSRN